jgi:hypothetical protein
MRNYLSYITGLIFCLSVFSCSNPWDSYFDYPDTLERKVFDELKGREDLSSFVDLIIEYRLDTLFTGNHFYTIFVPDNNAISNFIESADFSGEILRYHIINQFIHIENYSGKRKVETILGKYALLDNGEPKTYDEALIKYNSPLFLDGKFYIIDRVVEPKLSLYEYFSRYCPALKKYIDSKDSIIIDRELSIPVDFDEDGNIIYDTVGYLYNAFEEMYFPVRKEMRSRTATLVFPRNDLYMNALEKMALDLGGSFSGPEDIPELWQQEVLIPYLLKQGMFLNMIEEHEFQPPPRKDFVRMRNIVGDSVTINYRPVGKMICSNGYTYDYQSFTISDSLFRSKARFEAERLVVQTGINRWDWRNFVKVTSSIAFSPIQEHITVASNDSIVRVSFPYRYSQDFSVEFRTDNIFPNRYRVVVGTHMNIGGIYNIYVNDELVRTFDYYDYVRYRGVLPSVTGQVQDRFVATGLFNKFDFWADITEYQQPKIRFEYVEPGLLNTNGFVLDFIEFIPQ